MTEPILSKLELAKMIDHSLLKPTLTREDTIAGVETGPEIRRGGSIGQAVLYRIGRGDTGRDRR